jgi:hypothetical protein
MRHRGILPNLLHGFQCARQLVLQNDLSCFIQNAVRAGPNLPDPHQWTWTSEGNSGGEDLFRKRRARYFLPIDSVACIIDTTGLPKTISLR